VEVVMHPEAREGFAWALGASGLRVGPGLRVLDVGGQDVNGTVHDLLLGAEVTTLDLENADIIADARTWVPDRLFDLVIATEVFEHVREWRNVLLTMRAALDERGPGVLVATCASAGRPAHGATGAPLPVLGEHYENVHAADLRETLRTLFTESQVSYRHPPGDAYMWARA
jgi:hypothetical protein